MPDQKKTVNPQALAEQKNRIISEPGFIVCSECRYGFNGQKSCYKAQSIGLRVTLGCSNGQLIPGLKGICYGQCRQKGLDEKRTGLYMRRLGLLPDGLQATDDRLQEKKRKS
jgi:hypothetical protein